MEIAVRINMKREVTNSNSAESGPYAHLIQKLTIGKTAPANFSFFSNHFEHNWIMSHVETEAKAIIICTCTDKCILLSAYVKETCSCILLYIQ